MHSVQPLHIKISEAYKSSIELPSTILLIIFTFLIFINIYMLKQYYRYCMRSSIKSIFFSIDIVMSNNISLL